MTKVDKYIITIKVIAQHEKNNDRCGDFRHALCMSVREIIPYTVKTINLSYDVKKVDESFGLNTLTWQDIRRIVKIAAELCVEWGPERRHKEGKEAYYKEVLKRYYDND